jgi:membrane-associated phospholipid phosphatase
MAFAAAGFLGAAFGLLYPDSPWKLPVWGLSLAWAGLTALLRLDAGMHFLTDVLAAAALGSLWGVLIPELRFSMEQARAEALPTPAGSSFPVLQMTFSY